jgi:hypothetical protein
MSSTPRRVLVVFVDAFGRTQLDRFGEHLDFLPHRRGLRGILGYSSGALPTVLTGAPPATHGRMCLFSKRADADESILSPLAWLGLLPAVLHERAALRRWLGRALAHAAGLTGYVALHRVPPEAFRWLDLPERDDLFRADRIGAASTFLADARRAGLSVLTARWQSPEAERWAAAYTELERRQPDLAFLYVTELDGALHARGNDAPEIEEVVRRFAARIARARERLGADGTPVTTIVVGDHGMADVTRVVDPRPVLAQLGAAQAFVDSTMIRLWGGEAALSRARLALERAALPGAWLDAGALRERRVPMEGAPFAEALWLLPEGTLFAPSFLGGRVRGMHGYDVGASSAFAGLASDDPAVLGATALTDVAGIVRERLSLPAAA